MEGTTYSALIVDDEPLARRRIRQLLSQAPDFEVIGECSDGGTMVDAVRAGRPDVVFLDVQMIHTDGFAALSQVRDALRHVVFVTAFPEHATTAFDVAALDYLVKPLTQARFNDALDRVRRAGVAGEAPRVFLGTQQGGVAVPIADIGWVEADGAYVVVHAAGKRHVLRASLNEMIARLGAAHFARIHRSAVVNLDRVRAVRRARDHGLEVELTDSTRVPVSRRQARQVIARLHAAGARPGGAVHNQRRPIVPRIGAPEPGARHGSGDSTNRPC